MRAAVAAVVADLSGNPPKEGETSKKPEKRAQRADVPAPVPPFKPLKGKDEKEDGEGEERQGIEGLAEGQDVIPEKIIEKCDIVASFSGNLIEARPPRPGHMADEGIEEEGKGPHEDRDGVEDARDVHGKQGHRQKRKEEIVPERAFQETDGGALRDTARDEIDHGPQGAYPAAEEPSQDNGEDRHQERRQEKHRKTFHGQYVAHQDERIRPEKAVDGNGYLILSPIVGDDEKEHKEGQEEELGDAGGGKSHKDRFRFYVLSFKLETSFVYVVNIWVSLCIIYVAY